MTEFQPLHGGQLQQIADRFGISSAELLDFSANINPDGPPPEVPIVLQQAISKPSILMNYPDLDEVELRQSLASYCGTRPENLVVANGFVPLLDAALQVLSPRICLVPVPAFVEYRRTLERSKVEMIPFNLASDSDFKCDAADLFNDSSDAILLANPQNPSGVLWPRETILSLLELAAERKMHLLLDEAFIDYYPEASLISEIDRFANLIVFRSVTKFFGIAGLRVAYAVANAELSKRLQEVIAPWAITSLTSLAAGVAVRDATYIHRTIALNSERRGRLHTAVFDLGIRLYPSEANFLLLRLPESISRQQLWERMIRKHHIVLRNCANYEGLSNSHLRVAVRTNADNERLIEALAYEVKHGR